MTKQQTEQKKGSFMKDLIIIIVAAVAIATVVKLFIVDSRVVPSESMYPTVYIGDRVLINKLAYVGDATPQRGDIVVFTGPPDAGVDGDLIKRVIGLPGETLEIKNGLVYIDGNPLTDEYYIEEPPNYEYGPVAIPDGCYFMMGDNRNNSADSHYWSDPFIKEEAIKGKAFLRYWPLDRIGFLAVQDGTYD